MKSNIIEIEVILFAIVIVIFALCLPEESLVRYLTGTLGVIFAMFGVFSNNYKPDNSK